MVTRDYKVEVSGKLFDVKVIGEAVAGGAAPAAGGKKPPKRERKAGGGAAASSEALPSPLQGTVLKVAVERGRRGRRGRPDLRDRGDEDGERDHRPPRRQSHRAERRRGRRGRLRRHPRRHRVAVARAASRRRARVSSALPASRCVRFAARAVRVPLWRCFSFAFAFSLFRSSFAPFLVDLALLVAGQREFRRRLPGRCGRRRSRGGPVRRAGRRGSGSSCGSRTMLLSS